MNSDDATDKLIEGIIVDAYGEDVQLWAFRQVIEDFDEAAAVDRESVAGCSVRTESRKVIGCAGTSCSALYDCAARGFF